MSLLPKAQSVNAEGQEDNFIPAMAWQAQVLEGGYTRLEISSPPGTLGIIHQSLVEVLSFPCKLRYVKLTDRSRGQLSSPESYVAVEIPRARLIQSLQDFFELIYHDGRHQLWIQSADEVQLVLDELGVIYVYPDDFQFRDKLCELGWVEAKHQSMANRDYVRVNFSSSADEQEAALIQSMGLVRWEG